MRKILLISDTHGKLDTINEKVLQTTADFVIHAGDFGFYDEQSLTRLSPRELRLLISHSPFWRQYSIDKQSNREELIDIVKTHQLLGDFPDYISGKKQFSAPIYSAWGNHEDVQVLKNLRKDLKIHNLHLLDENNSYEFHHEDKLEFSLYGLGGNFLATNKLFDKPIAGNGGKVWSTLHQFGVLYNQVKRKNEPSIFVSHVSPGKEPLLTRLMLHFSQIFGLVDIWVLRLPVWNQFTIHEMDEALDWLQVDTTFIEEQYKLGRLSEEAILAYDIIKRDIPKKDDWFKKMWNINLPDAKDGHAILTVEDGRFFSRDIFSLLNLIGEMYQP